MDRKRKAQLLIEFRCHFSRELEVPYPDADAGRGSLRHSEKVGGGLEGRVDVAGIVVPHPRRERPGHLELPQRGRQAAEHVLAQVLQRHEDQAIAFEDLHLVRQPAPHQQGRQAGFGGSEVQRPVDDLPLDVGGREPRGVHVDTIEERRIGVRAALGAAHHGDLRERERRRADDLRVLHDRVHHAGPPVQAQRRSLLQHDHMGAGLEDLVSQILLHARHDCDHDDQRRHSDRHAPERDPGDEREQPPASPRSQVPAGYIPVQLLHPARLLAVSFTLRSGASGTG